MCRFVGVCAAEGEGVVTVGFGWVVEGAIILSFDFCGHIIYVLCFILFVTAT